MSHFKSKDLLVSFLGFISLCSLANAQATDVRHQLQPNQFFALEFGTDVATDGEYVVVGSPFSLSEGGVFVYDAQSGEELRYIENTTTSIRFGRAIDIHLGTVAVGAEGLGSFFGEASLIDANNGALLHSLNPTDSMEGDRFGSSIAIDGDYVVVGARNDDTHATGAGSAYLFDRETGQQLYKFEPTGSKANDNYGWSVAIHGDLVGVGSRIGGVVYLYSASSGSLIDTLQAPEPDNRFGNALSIDTQYIAVAEAALGFDSQVHVFSRDSLEHLYSIDGVSEFGNDIAIDDGVLVVGFFRRLDGLVYVYDAESGQQLTQIMTAGTESFGDAVAIRNRTIAVGDYLADQAFIIDFNPCNPADLAIPYYQLSFFDVSVFIGAFNAQEPRADVNGDGEFDFFDVSAFLNAYQAGCS
jgi:hypothetical protein